MATDPFDDMKLVFATQKLISEVRSRPVIWNKHVSRTKDDIAAAWLEVCNAMNMQDVLIKPKWKNLKDIFKREFTKTQKLGKDDPKWRYYKHLKFLKVNFLDRNDIEGSEIEQETVQRSLTTVIKLEPFERQDRNMQLLLVDPIDTSYVSENASQDLDETNATTQAKNDREYDLLFLKSLLPFFNNLTPVRKLVVRTKIQEILLNEMSRKYESEN